MPLASNPLLQTTSMAASKTNAANSVAKAADNGKDDSSSFSDVYANQAHAKSAANNDVPVKPARDKTVPAKDKDVAAKDPAAKDDAAGDQTTVADSGNTLPADDAVAALPVETPAHDVALDPALQAMVQPVVVPVNDALVADPAAVSSATAAMVAASAATPSAAVASSADLASDASFDPEADPLAGLPALQFALENASAKAQAAQQANGSNHSDKTGKSSGNDSADSAQNIANNLTALADQLPTDEASTESSDKSFSGLLDDGLKDVKSAGGDTRMDNFAERLAAMSQAAQAPRAALTPVVPLINQPLAMHQSGWSEGVVDRVMYLSSQNLKSAEIQLEPAELGRLDIRVNMATDQQTQVTFMSAHVGVREALENQMSRLRESFSQQGLGQVDVNVSDQNRGWQQQQQQSQDQASNSQRSSGTSGSSSSLDGSGDGGQVDAGVAVSQPAARVIGSSEVDYYA
ncbi:flagellar hook-length control protein [Pseudomonas syringae]|uniref:Flagellar hook-length control protein n=1 Tax=Pseudomonas syringae TaxID=317 RepID=A0A1C7Z895_PSESX|nr:flagellar hook-length control protein FliK [Pseudomonas syringae]OCR24678.1 flagellar hook-length control protein [Pseudomonas syringae]